MDIAFIRIRCEYAELDNKARSDKVLQDEAETQLLNQGKRGTRRIGKAKVGLLKSERQGADKGSGAGKETPKARNCESERKPDKVQHEAETSKTKQYKTNIAAGLAETDV